MPTQGTTDDLGLGAAAKQVAERASSIARLELELAGLELKQKVASLGLGIGLAAGAALVALYTVGFLFATFAAVLAIFLDLWLSLLIVFFVLLLVTAILGLLAVNRIKRGTPPVPQQAIEEAKRTTAAIKSNGS